MAGNQRRLETSEVLLGLGAGIGAEVGIKRGLGSLLSSSARKELSKIPNSLKIPSTPAIKLDAMRRERGVTTKVTIGTGPGGIPAFYAPMSSREHNKYKAFAKQPNPSTTRGWAKLKKIVGPDNVKSFINNAATGKGGVAFAKSDAGMFSVAHELTHAQAGKSMLGRTWLHGARLGHKYLAPIMGIGMATSDPDSKTSRSAQTASLALSAPLLVEEARANIGGYRSLKNLKYDKAALRAAGRQGIRGFSTYLAPVVATSAAIGVTRGISKYLKKKKNQ